MEVRWIVACTGALLWSGALADSEIYSYPLRGAVCTAAEVSVKIALVEPVTSSGQ